MNKIEVGKIYKRRDNLKVCVYRYDNVQDMFYCVVIGTGEFYSVYKNGNYFSASISNNDLIAEFKGK